MTAAEITAFQKKVLSWYAQNGRHELPWRQTSDPYKILVSELMLQQTQVERVIPKFTAFLDTFPTARVLSEASLSSVLKLWQGLGYNRRAKFLQQTARGITHKHAGVFPEQKEALLELPGIGPYTSTAICTFAFNQPHIVIETNIRTVFIHHFFAGQKGVSDADMTPLIEKTVDTNNPREWYAALMDYGSFLKKNHPNPSRRSKHHTKQSKFQGSPRQTRGEIIRALTQKKLSLSALKAAANTNPEHFTKALESLLNENMIVQKNDQFKIPE